MQKTMNSSWDRGAIPGEKQMAIGAIFFSMPAAACGALYMCLFNGLSPVEGLALYSALGTAMVLAVTLLPLDQQD